MPLCGKEDPIDGMLCPFADEVWSVMSFFTPRVPKWDDPVFEISHPRSFASWKALPCLPCLRPGEWDGGAWRGRAGTLEVSSISHGASASSSVLGRPHV